MSRQEGDKTLLTNCAVNEDLECPSGMEKLQYLAEKNNFEVNFMI